MSIEAIMKDIFDHIRSSETEKELEVRPELWKRMDRRLSHRKHQAKPNWKKLAWMAACMLIIIVAMFGLSMQSSAYEVEDFKSSGMPYFTMDQISPLQKDFDATNQYPHLQFF